MNDPASAPPTVGASILALLLVLSALLCWMLAGSALLATPEGKGVEWPVVWISSAFGAAYAVLARGVLTRRRWDLPVAVLLLALVLSAGLADVLRREVIALDSLLTFALAFAANLATVMALWLARMLD